LQDKQEPQIPIFQKLLKRLPYLKLKRVLVKITKALVIKLTKINPPQLFQANASKITLTLI
jgi:hypothetical protein